MAKTQKYGITFPFTIDSVENTTLDMDSSKVQMVKSQLIHLLFTPKGQRIRQPDFGTNLIQFLFNSSDEAYEDVVAEIKECVKNYVPDCTLNDIEIYETDDGLGLLAKLYYSVSEDDGSTVSYAAEIPV